LSQPLKSIIFISLSLKYRGTLIRGRENMIVNLSNLDKYKDRLSLLKIRTLNKFENLVLLSHITTKRKLIVGEIKCPYCGESLELSIMLQETPRGPSVEQSISKFIDHMDKKHPEFFKEWMYRSKQPYQQGSWHMVMYYVCRKCGYKSRRLTDVLVHLIVKHKFR